MALRALALTLTLATFGCSDDATSDGAAADASVGDLALGDQSIADLEPGDGSASADHDAAVWSGPEFLFLDGESGLGAPILDASPDEAGNLWAVAPDALYILRAGEKTFRRYTNADGLHIYSTITSVAGAGPNEGFVGLEGYEDDNVLDDTDEQRRVGKAEHVHLLSDGTITSFHYAEMHNDDDLNSWETRSARRLLYGHDGPNAGHLFLGANHGITNVLNDQYGDHIHAEIWWMPEQIERLGQWYGLAFDPTTAGVWTCGRFGCGLQNFVADPRAWVLSKGYIYAFTTFADGHPLEVASGYEEHDVGVAVSPDTTVWILSKDYGLASWRPNQKQDYSTIARVSVPGLGLPVDIVADPDGTLWIADTDHVLRYDPHKGSAVPFALPNSDVRRLYLDLRSAPRGLYVSTGAGVAVYHGP